MSSRNFCCFLFGVGIIVFVNVAVNVVIVVVADALFVLVFVVFIDAVVFVVVVFFSNSFVVAVSSHPLELLGRRWRLPIPAPTILDGPPILNYTGYYAGWASVTLDGLVYHRECFSTIPTISLYPLYEMDLQYSTPHPPCYSGIKSRMWSLCAVMYHISFHSIQSFTLTFVRFQFF